jgi:glycine hydroxymethyltransferase
MGRDHELIGPDGKRTLSQYIQSAVFPMMQGSPATHVIAAKARAFARLLEPEYKLLTERILYNAQILAKTLRKQGYHIISGGTDNHIVLFRVQEPLTGLIVERALERCNILVNKNKVPRDVRTATVPSGIRLGTNTISLRKLSTYAVKECALLIDNVIKAIEPINESEFYLPEHIQEQTKARIQFLCRQFPLPYVGDGKKQDTYKKCVNQ